MAEVLAGFLTSAVVGIAKDKLASAIAEQANLLWNFGDDLENMNSVLESISAALQDAERGSVKEKLVQLWLKRVKNAAFDISDLLEDYQDTSDRLTAAKAKFDVDTRDPTIKKACIEMMKLAVRQQRYKLKKEFFDPFPLHLVMKTSPVHSMSDKQWIDLGESWKTPKKWRYVK